MQDVVKSNWIFTYRIIHPELNYLYSLVQLSYPELNYLYEASSKDKVQKWVEREIMQ